MILQEETFEIRPMRDLVAYQYLPKKTQEFYGSLAHPGLRVRAVILGRIVAVGPEAKGVKKGDLVLLESQSAPFGAPRLSAKALGCETAGLGVFFAPCRLVPRPDRDMEFRRRHNRLLEIEKEFPESDPIWGEPGGETLRQEMAWHFSEIRAIFIGRKSQGRSRLFPLGKLRETLRRFGVALRQEEDGGDIPEGVLGVIEE